MTDLIQWHSEVKLQPLVTPSGSRWHADETILVGGILLNKDISSLFPYINAVVQKAVYLAQPPFIRFRYEAVLCALHPFYMAAYPFGDGDTAIAFFNRLVAFLNDLHQRRPALRPNPKTYNPVSVLAILKLLPRSNCRKCGYATCMAFAGAVRTGRTIPQQCPELAAPLAEKAVYAMYDDQGNIAGTVDLEMNSSQTLKEMAAQRNTIELLEKRISALTRQGPTSRPDYKPPFGMELSPREMEVLRLMAHGTTNTEMSQILGISPHTVKSHVNGIFNKLGVNDRTQAAVWAARNGII